jgi:Xaa-Pro dipeptidase
MTKMFDSTELKLRMGNFKKNMDRFSPDWELAIIVSKINMFYFTGTRQDGALVIPRDGKPIFWVRRVYSRAVTESAFVDIFPMNSFSDVAGYFTKVPKSVHVEKGYMSMAKFELINKHFAFEKVLSLDAQINHTRSIKTAKELKVMTKTGKIHKHILQSIVPSLLYEGVSEKNFFGKLYFDAMKAGYQGVSRFSNLDCDCILGQVGFGENSIVPTTFDSPGGQKGLSPAVPAIGDESRFLNNGDLVFVDLGVGYGGYHTDATMTYVFKGQVSDQAKRLHDTCVKIRQCAKARLLPGEIPSEIYRDIIGGLDSEFLEYFMGTKGNQVKFLGHGVGLCVDEAPVIADKFDMPLEQNMIVSLEPKCAILGVGTVGVEDTYIVNKTGAQCLTGEPYGLLSL